MDAIVWLLIAVGAVSIVIAIGVWQRSAGFTGSRPDLPKLVSKSSGGVSVWPFGEARFDEVIGNPQNLTESVELKLKDYLNQLFLSQGIGNVGIIVVQKIMVERNAYTVIFSPEGQRLLNSGSLKIMNGQWPVLVGLDGKIYEIARIAPALFPKLAVIVPTVVAIAHIISNIDLVNRLEQLDRKIDWLVKMRAVDQWATLERIFYAARELCSAPIGEWQKQKLWSLRQELRQLRITLRREWMTNIEQFEPRDSWSIPVIRDWMRSQKRRRLLDALSGDAPRVLMIEFALRLELVMAMADRSEQAFFRSLADELAHIDQVFELIDRKAQKLESPPDPFKWREEVFQQYRSLAQATALIEHRSGQ